MLYGPPGIGKTQILYQLAEEIAEATGRTLIDANDLLALAQNPNETEDEIVERLLQEDESKYFVFKGWIT